MKKTVLIADDDESIAWVLERFFKEKGFEVSIARDGVTCARLLKETNPLITLLDINMPGKDGLAVLRGAEPSFDGAVIVMTAESTMKNAIEAMKLGAFDYLSKPVDLDELDVLTERAMRNRAIEKELGALKERLNEKLSTETVFVGKSKAVEKVFKTIGRIAPKDVPVLIQGESGTGKELVAKLIHANSPRREGPFIAVNSAAVPKELMESELFGHEKGAFTGATERRPGKFELANEGTLLLDEIADMDVGLQAKLLRALQEMEFYRVGGRETVKIDVRIIAATNQDLEKMVEEKKFRDDLLFRLNVVTVTIPPLRERKEDVSLLCDYFLEKFRAESGGNKRGISADAMEDLKNYSWPGNVRELENVLRKALILSPALTLTPLEMEIPKRRLKKDSLEDLIEKRLEPFLEKTLSHNKAGDLYAAMMPFMERPLIKLVLRKTRFNQVQAAELLGINRNTLRKKIKELKITEKDVR